MKVVITITVPPEGSEMEEEGVLEQIEALLIDVCADFTWENKEE